MKDGQPRTVKSLDGSTIGDETEALSAQYKDLATQALSRHERFRSADPLVKQRLVENMSSIAAILDDRHRGRWNSIGWQMAWEELSPQDSEARYSMIEDSAPDLGGKGAVRGVCRHIFFALQLGVNSVTESTSIRQRYNGGSYIASRGHGHRIK
jgi:hypothetical protein